MGFSQERRSCPIRAFATPEAWCTSAEAAVAHVACLLGLVTHRANVYHATQPGDGGGIASKVLRDSTHKPTRLWVSGTPPAPSVVCSGPISRAHTPSAKAGVVLPWLHPRFRCMPKASEGATRDVGVLARRVEAIDAMLAPRCDGPSAADRINAIAARLRARDSIPLQGVRKVVRYCWRGTPQHSCIAACDPAGGVAPAQSDWAHSRDWGEPRGACPPKVCCMYSLMLSPMLSNNGASHMA